MDLFEQTTQSSLNTPLAERMRPQTLADVVGQHHLLGSGKLLRQLIETDQLTSIIFWGPPGTGKTTLGRVIANCTKSRFVFFSAVLGSIKDVREIVAEAKQQRNYNSALLSRSRVFVLEPLAPEDLKILLQRAVTSQQGLNRPELQVDEAAFDFFAEQAGGDARIALGALEVAAATAPNNTISLEVALEALQKKALLYDKGGEEHYNVISAFIKSMRGSDPDGAIYWLARMLEAGEDPLFIVRRMVIFASEDIGNADPRALQIALSVQQAVHFVGLPEARINLAQGVTYLATAPKSNASYTAINKAQAEVKASGALPVPKHIRNAPTKLMKQLDYGKGYKYAHNYRDGFADQTHLPDAIGKKTFYRPTDRGYEKTINERLAYLRNANHNSEEKSE